MNHSPGPWTWEDWGMALNDSAGGLVLGTGSGMNKADAALIALAPEMREMLLALEWSGSNPLTGMPACPELFDCGGNRKQGHSPRCKLAALLEKLR